jgi:hypothetical protein
LPPSNDSFPVLAMVECPNWTSVGNVRFGATASIPGLTTTVRSRCAPAVAIAPKLAFTQLGMASCCLATGQRQYSPDSVHDEDYWAINLVDHTQAAIISNATSSSYT